MRIGQLAVDLDISPTTVRRWTERYSDFLSDEAINEREYTERDIGILRVVQTLRDQDVGHAEIEKQLREMPSEEEESTSLAYTDSAVIDGVEDGSTAAAITQLLRHLDDTQQSVLNTQLANRDLLGIVVQDNFNLKEENARLRKRLRTLEHEVSRLKESDWSHRLSVEERLTELQQQLKNKKPWWKRLLGL